MADITLPIIHTTSPMKTIRDIVLLTSAVATIVGAAASSAFAFKEGYLPARELLDKGWASGRIEKAYEECENEMPFYWNALSLPGRSAAYFLHE